jgi:hypothetical protein
MTETLSDIFTQNVVVHLIALVAAFLFFLMAGLRALKHQDPEGFLFLTLAVFFFLIHIFYMANFPDDSPLLNPFTDWSAWNWLVVLAAPSLIALYLTLGAFHLFVLRIQQGLYGIFFGLTLVCFLYMVGGQWPLDVKGVLTLTWGTLWFNLELNPVSQ